jgi:hypothetical protein
MILDFDSMIIDEHLTSVCGGSGTPKSGQVVKWKCRMVRTVSPRMIRNSDTFQSGKWLSLRIVTCKRDHGVDVITDFVWNFSRF